MITYKAIAKLRFKDGTEMDMTIHHYRTEEEAQFACKNYSYAGAKVMRAWVEEQEVGESTAIGKVPTKKRRRKSKTFDK